MPSEKPVSVRLFPYRVGFGDCFLLRFEYAKGARHVLIDFGSTAPASRQGYQLEEIAQDIRRKVTEDGKRPRARLDAIVATHRHQDHVRGFQGAPWMILKSLSPHLVVLPWTEHPRAARDAKFAPTGGTGRIGPLSMKHVQSLAAMHSLAEAALDELIVKGDPEALLAAGYTPSNTRVERRRLPTRDSPSNEDRGQVAAAAGPEALVNASAPFTKGVTEQLAFLGAENLGNKEAMENLLGLPCDFVSFGSKTRLAKLLPGVRVEVLGPPTLAQSETILKQRSTDREEFWHFAASAARAGVDAMSRSLFPGFEALPPEAAPLQTRWFLRQLDGLRGDQLLGIVRILDNAMNNTSVILLFEVLGKKLLFPGDAQIENWRFALSQPGVAERLANVDFYKVGHHGSLNATPRSMWDAFVKKGSKGKRNRLKTAISTRPGKHGSYQRSTEVPRRTLMAVLREESELFSTHDDLTGKERFVPEEPIILAP